MIKKTLYKENSKTMMRGLLSDGNRYTSPKGEISLLSPCYATMDMFEIYCIDGDLFEDIERYETIQDAEIRISKLLT